MNNADVRQADGLLRQVFTAIDNNSMLDIKQKAFEDIKVKLYKALVLMDSKPKKVNINFVDYSMHLISFFTDNYPEWQDRRRRRLSRVPRQLLQYFLTKHSNFSLKEIADLTGGYNHTTIISSKRVVKNMIETRHPEYCEIYNKVIEFLNGLKESK